MDIVPFFHTDEAMIILTESASFDPQLVQKTNDRLQAGKDVMITPGLLRALHDKGSIDTAELTFTERKEPVTVKILAKAPITRLTDLLSQESLAGIVVKPNVPDSKSTQLQSFEINIPPHSYRVFQTK